MLKSFFCSRQWAWWAWGGLFLLCATVGLEVAVQVWINSWYRETWDFLQNPHPLLSEAIMSNTNDWNMKLAELDSENYADSNDTLAILAGNTLERFWGYLGEFCIVVFPYIVIRAFSGFFAQHYAFRWRQAITFAYLPLWSKAEKEIEGASQRLQQDPERFARLVESLGLGLFRSVLTLGAFVPILWGVSKEISDKYNAALGLNNAPFELPFFAWTANTVGSLMWVAIGLAIGGTIISYFVGIRLPGLEYNNQKVEARFRKQLVYSEDDKSYVRNETMVELFTGLRFNYFRLYLHYSYFSLWAVTFSQVIVIADLALVGSGVALGVISLGFINQISHAFSKVTDSLAYFVDHWTTVTELMSVVKRLREFEHNIGYSKAGKAGLDNALPPAEQVK
ncbi:MAG: putative transporter [Proteobacteria bacterium]|nr:putative transporter [Pseudomonadota bacterium]MCH9757632.1 putative transporter [Pseudomonadota bacterium]